MADQTAEFDVAWRIFQRADSLRLAEDTLESEWTHGRSEFAALLVRMMDAGAIAAIERTLEAISGIPGVDPYPKPYWHATVKGLGFVVEAPSAEDELSAARLAEIAEAARPVIESTPAFGLRLGRPGAFAEVVIMEVLDGGAIRSLNMRLLEAVPGLLRGPFDGAVFLPHVSIARFRSQEGLGQLKERLSRLRASFGSLRMSVPGFEVREVELIRAHLSSAAPTFGLVGAYGLGART
jgi:2'-5' RNA ligase